MLRVTGKYSTANKYLWAVTLVQNSVVGIKKSQLFSRFLNYNLHAQSLIEYDLRAGVGVGVVVGGGGAEIEHKNQ